MASKQQYAFARNYNPDHTARQQRNERQAAEAARDAKQQAETDWERSFKQLYVDFIENQNLHAQDGVETRDYLGNLCERMVGYDPFAELETTAIECNRRGIERRRREIEQNDTVSHLAQQLAIAERYLDDHLHQAQDDGAAAELRLAQTAAELQATQQQMQRDLAQAEETSRAKDRQIAQLEQSLAQEKIAGTEIQQTLDRTTRQLANCQQQLDHKSQQLDYKSRQLDHTSQQLAHTSQQLASVQQKFGCHQKSSDTLMSAAAQELRRAREKEARIRSVIQGFGKRSTESMLSLHCLEAMSKAAEEMLNDEALVNACSGRGRKQEADPPQDGEAE